jgi:hypothetical protein
VISRSVSVYFLSLLEKISRRHEGSIKFLDSSTIPVTLLPEFEENPTISYT